MGKDYIETIPRQVKDAELASDSIDHTAISDSFITLDSGDPAASNDTGEGYVLGSLWVNTTSGQQFVCKRTTAEDAQWIGQEGDNINVFTVGTSAGYGFSLGGGPPSATYGEYIRKFPQANPSNPSTDVGELLAGGISGMGQGCSHSSTAIYTTGGFQQPPGANAYVDTIQYCPFATNMDSSDAGEIGTGTNSNLGRATSGSKIFVVGGVTNPAGSAVGDIYHFPTATSGITASDSGAEMAAASGFWDGSVGSDNANSYVYYHNSPASLERFSMGITTGTATDVGEFSPSKNSACGSGSDTEWGVAGGGSGSVSSDFHKMSYSSSASVSDVGEMQRSMRNGHSCSDNSHMYIMGGPNGYPGNTNPTVDQVDQISWTSPGSSANVGEMVTIADSALGNSGPS